MQRQSAFENDGALLKGSLHNHTTRSDGKGTPEEQIRLYAARGYDFIALTDHRIYNTKHFAPDVDILVLPGIEIDGSFPDAGIHCYHVVGIGSARNNGCSHDQHFDGRSVTGPADMQPAIDALRNANNLAIYCHPEWSGTPAREFDSFTGCFAMEVYNASCAVDNDLDTNAPYWDELLLQGKRLWGVATDDGHNDTHYFHGWVRVNAKRDVEDILGALERGAFYATCGPEIYDFYIEDGVAHLRCSPCQKVWFRHGYLPSRLITSDTGLISYATMKIPQQLSYLRTIVMDAQGNRAWTNPIFLADHTE